MFLAPMLVAATLATTPVEITGRFRENEGICSSLSDYAATVMTLRQSGVSLNDLIKTSAEAYAKQRGESVTAESVALILVTTVYAYEFEIQPTAKRKHDLVKAFADKVKQDCYQIEF